MRRREFITFLGGAAVAWPLAAHAQQNERVRRIGVLLPATADDKHYQIWLGAFLQGLAQAGWNIGQNVQIDTRWATASAAVADPIGAGFVDSLARPGRNATGFMAFEYGLSGKWLEFLKHIVPTLTRAAVLRYAGIPTGPAQFGVIQAIAPALNVEITQVNLRDTPTIEHAITAFAGSPNGGLIIAGSGLAYIHRDLIIKLAAERRLPAIYFDRQFVAAGGLISYGPDLIDQFRRAAGYVDRVLRGEKPADMPVQAPTKYELVVNLKTAKALGLTVPPSVLAQASEVIE